MSDRNKPPLSPEDSSSEQSSQSPDALDSASARDLTRAINRHTERLNSIDRKIESIESKSFFREQAQQKAIELNTAAMEHHNARSDGMMRIVREVLAEERKDRKAIGDGMAKLGRVVEETGKHMIPPKEAEDEISAQHIKIRWSTIAKYAPFVFKTVAIIGGAAIAVWHFAGHELRAAWRYLFD